MNSVTRQILNLRTRTYPGAFFMALIGPKKSIYLSTKGIKFTFHTH